MCTLDFPRTRPDGAETCEARLDLAERQRRALVRSEIEALHAEFAWLIDHDESQRVAELFTEAGSYGRAGGGRSTGREALRRVYAARSARCARTARHLFTNVRLQFGDDPGRVRGHCILLLYAHDGHPPHPPQTHLVADYMDEYELGDDGRWRYASRTVRHLFAEAGNTPVLPLGQA